MHSCLSGHSYYTSPSIREELEHVPLHCPQAAEHSRPCFRQLHCFVAHPVLQLHLTISESSAGAGSFSIAVCVGNYVPFWMNRPHFSGSKSFPINCCTCRYTRKLWNLAAALVGGCIRGWTCAVLLPTGQSKRVKSISQTPIIQESDGFFYCHYHICWGGVWVREHISCYLKMCVIAEQLNSHSFAQTIQSWCWIATQYGMSKQNCTLQDPKQVWGRQYSNTSEICVTCAVIQVGSTHLSCQKEHDGTVLSGDLCHLQLRWLHWLKF